MDAGSWTDSRRCRAAALGGAFTVARPRDEVILAVRATRPARQTRRRRRGQRRHATARSRGIARHRRHSIPPPGAALDYASIFDADAGVHAHPASGSSGSRSTLGAAAGDRARAGPGTDGSPAGPGRHGQRAERRRRGDGARRAERASDDLRSCARRASPASATASRAAEPAGRPGRSRSPSPPTAGTTARQRRRRRRAHADGDGPTATLANPSAGTGIDINLLNQRNWIDIVFPGTSALDEDSITDRRRRDRAQRRGPGHVSSTAASQPLVERRARARCATS